MTEDTPSLVMSLMALSLNLWVLRRWSRRDREDRERRIANFEYFNGAGSWQRLVEKKSR